MILVVNFTKCTYHLTLQRPYQSGGSELITDFCPSAFFLKVSDHCLEASATLFQTLKLPIDLLFFFGKSCNHTVESAYLIHIITRYSALTISLSSDPLL